MILHPFQHYFSHNQEDGWMIMEGFVQWNPVYGWEEFASRGGGGLEHISRPGLNPLN